MSNFQSVLKSLRKVRGLTQDELAKMLKISRSAIGMYENGSREPDYETLELIADYFNVDIDYLLGRTNKTTILPEHLSERYNCKFTNAANHKNHEKEQLLLSHFYNLNEAGKKK